MFRHLMIAGALALASLCGAGATRAANAPPSPPEGAPAPFQPRLDYAFTIEIVLQPATSDEHTSKGKPYS